MSRFERGRKEDAYTFGDSELAARRLDLVAKVFAPTSRVFLQEAVGFRPRLALDLGSGLGHTTCLITDTLKPEKTVGIERSVAFLSAAWAKGQNSSVSFVEHDATKMPLPLGDAGLIYARFLLAHLSQPESAVIDWVTQLRPGGLLLLEEVEWIRTGHPTLSAYLEIVAAMMAHHGNELSVGPRLDVIADDAGRRRRLSRVVRLRPTTGQAARMFSMNLANWQEDAFVRATYPDEAIDRLEADSSCSGA